MKDHFFEVRRKLNRETFLLYFLFGLTTFALLGLVHLIISKVDWNSSIYHVSLRLNDKLAWDSEINLAISIGLLIFILGCYLYKYITTRRGDMIARQLGGVEITNNHSNPYYTAFNRAIIEMSLTANIPPPRAFILPNDDTINAFAAGTIERKDAVIAITSGALKALTPSELKALVAHEVSHIANGDTKMNRRVTAVIFGFMALTTLSYSLFRIGSQLRGSRSSKQNNTAAIMLAFFAAALFTLIVSKILEFFGKIIQSCLSRKREYYADNQAIVSMRTAYPIYSLLLKLKTKDLPFKNPHAQSFGERLNKKFGKSSAPEYQHFYFNHSSMFSAFATHPPLNERIKATVELMSALDRAKLQEKSTEKTLGEMYGDNWEHGSASLNNITASDDDVMGFNASPAIATAFIPTLQSQAEVTEKIPTHFIQALNDPQKLPLLIYAFLLSDNNMLRNQQLKIINDYSESDINQILSAINNNDVEYKSILYRLLYSKFHALPHNEKEQILGNALRLIQTGQLTIRNFALTETLKTLTFGNNNALQTQQKTVPEAIAFFTAFILQKGNTKYSLPEITQNFQQIMQSTDPDGSHTMPIITNDWPENFTESTDVLNSLSSNERKQYLTLFKNVVIHDRKISAEEYEILQLLGFCLNIPISIDLEIG